MTFITMKDTYQWKIKLKYCKKVKIYVFKKNRKGQNAIESDTANKPGH